MTGNYTYEYRDAQNSQRPFFQHI